MVESEILLLDEITANLDAETEHQVLQALKRASENRTVINIYIEYRLKRKKYTIITTLIYKSKKTIKKSPIIRNTIGDFLCIIDTS